MLVKSFTKLSSIYQSNAKIIANIYNLSIEAHIRIINLISQVAFILIDSNFLLSIFNYKWGAKCYIEGNWNLLLVAPLPHKDETCLAQHVGHPLTYTYIYMWCEPTSLF